MTGLEVVQQLMTEIGPRLELAEVIEFTEDESWLLAADEQSVVAVDYDAENAKLVFSAEVAEPSGSDRLALYQSLLEFNAQWPSTGGLRFGLEGPTGMVQMAFDLPIAVIDIQKLEVVVKNFLEQLDLWRSMVLEGLDGEPGEDQPTEQAGDPLQQGMIRA